MKNENQNFTNTTNTNIQNLPSGINSNQKS